MDFKKRFLRNVFLILLVFISAFSRAEDSSQLWQLVTNYSSEQLKGQANATSQLVVNEALLLQLKPGMALQLPIFSRTLEVQLTRSRMQGSTRIWSAKNNASPRLPDVQLFLRYGKLSAWIPTEFGTFRVVDGKLVKEYKMGGEHPDYRLPQATPALSQSGVSPMPINGGRSQSIQSVKASSAAAGDLVFRVLFVVTDEFVATYPETQAQLTEYITANNAIYEASGMNVQMEFAAMMQADLEQYSADQLLDNLSSNGGEDSTDGDIPDSELTPIWQARVDNSADFVVVMLNDLPEGLCGQGWLNGDTNQSFNYDYAVNVTAAFTTFGDTSQFCGYDTLGHELGHNMGLGHSLRQESEGTVFTFGRGYGVVDEFTTVMAYPSEFGLASGVAVFSSPDLTCLDSFACGVDREQDDGADAVYAVNQVKEQISLIHNDEITLAIDDARALLEDSALSNCIAEKFPDAITNAQVGFLVCTTDYDIQTINGLENFPNLSTFSMDGSNDTTLDVFQNMRSMRQLDVRNLLMTSMRPIAHLQDQLTFLQFNQSSLSCQDVNAVESWGIENFFPFGSCQSLSDDSDDFDGDGINNLNDTDDDNDGIDDVSDASPRDASNADDIDNDGVVDSEDAFPYNEDETLDTDNDTVGNNQDSDDDNDGVADTDDCAPLDNTQSTSCGSDDNTAPTISGSPATSVIQNELYSFTPTAADEDGDTLTFSIDNQPAWTSFSSSTGQLSGTPGSSDVGTYSNIVISVSDGEESTSMAAFDITVQESTDNNSSGRFVAYDYDGDGKADVGVRRASTYFQYILNSSDDDIQRIQFGRDAGDISVSGDFDGDKIADVAVRRPSNQFWYILNSSDGEIQRFNFGLQAEDIPVPADYDGDGITDIAVRRPSNQFWYILNSSDGEIQRFNFGLQEEDIPVPADYDGDGITDIAVRRPSTQFWYILNSFDGEIQRYNFGLQEADIPVPADYDGDGKADIAVRRPSTQFWYILNSSDGEIQRIQFGLQAQDIPIPADYDGDGKADVAVRRPSTQLQYILRSSDGEIERIQFGLNSADMPLAATVTTRMEVQVSDVTSARQANTETEVFIERVRLSAKQARMEQIQ